uniref:Putative secreted protein n=1 Tax=Xenopsylla cheopis TaxID=163159 RepID=A0A6M2DY71_XENCH
MVAVLVVVYRCHITACFCRHKGSIQLCGNVAVVGKKYRTDGIIITVTPLRDHCVHIVQLHTVALTRFVHIFASNIRSCFYSNNELFPYNTTFFIHILHSFRYHARF